MAQRATLMRKVSPHARRLRRNMTDAARLLWQELRDRRLQGQKFRRQWTIGNYVVDFCCIERKLVVEVDGGQHGIGRDAARTASLRDRGYDVIRFWNNDVLKNRDGVLEDIARRLESGPHPNPLPQAGEGA